MKKIHKEYLGEEPLSPIIRYDQMNTYYPTQISDLKFQKDYMTPRKTRLFQEYDENPTQKDLYVILFKHREIKMISNGNEISGVEII